MKFNFAATLLLASSAQAMNIKKMLLAQVDEPADQANLPVPFPADGKALDNSDILAGGLLDDIPIEAPGLGEAPALDASCAYRKYKLTPPPSIYNDEDDYSMPLKKSCGCSLPNVECPVVPEAKCDDLYTSLSDVIADSDAKDGNLYGNDE
jgi:hypothetical protein